MTRHSLSLVFIVLFGTAGARAADEAAGEARMREALRSTMLQLRTIETERDTLLSNKTAQESKAKTLGARIESLTKQSTMDRDAAEKTITELRAKLAEREAEQARLTDSLIKWKAGFQKASDLARAKEGERAKSASQVVVLERKVADQQRKNAEMHRLGLEILDRYEKFGIGAALTAREPFVGTTRVKFENLIQDYGDKLAEQRTKP